jgi:predicted small integral membrane protein
MVSVPSPVGFQRVHIGFPLAFVGTLTMSLHLSAGPLAFHLCDTESRAMIDDTDLMFRVAPLLLVGGTTLMATMVVLGNVTDPTSNLRFVERIMSMDTTYRSPRLMWRAITSARLQRLAFGAIVVLEAIMAVIGWIGTVTLAANLRADADQWHDAKFWALVAMCLALVVWFLIFDVGGNEWFASWQSETWRAANQTPRINLITLSAIVLLALAG